MSYATGLGYTPIFTISKGGEDITGHFTDRLTSITVSSYEGGGDSDTADIVIDDRIGPFRPQVSVKVPQF